MIAKEKNTIVVVKGKPKYVNIINYINIIYRSMDKNNYFWKLCTITKTKKMTAKHEVKLCGYFSISNHLNPLNPEHNACTNNMTLSNTIIEASYITINELDKKEHVKMSCEMTKFVFPFSKKTFPHAIAYGDKSVVPKKTDDVLDENDLAIPVFFTDNMSDIPDFHVYFIYSSLESTTEILMGDGQLKHIRDIQRGDIVAGDPMINKKYTVAKVYSTSLNHDTTFGTCEFQPGSLANNVPYKPLITATSHIIEYNNIRKPAYAFEFFPNVEKTLSKASDIVIPDNNGKYSLYDLQFETVGTYVANGVTVQSRSPYSPITPLAKELFFDESLYSDKYVDDYDNRYEYKLNCKVL